MVAPVLSFMPFSQTEEMDGNVVYHMRSLGARVRRAMRERHEWGWAEGWQGTELDVNFV